MSLTPATPVHAEVSAVLPDLLWPGLAVVFCGTAAGHASARVGSYYAGRGNRFWPTLAKTGLTPRLLRPDEFRELPPYGIGLTDIAKTTSGPDSSLRHDHFDAAGLTGRIELVGPEVLAFNGKKAAARFLGCRTQQLQYGWLTQQIGPTRLYVLPSTAGLAARYWDESHWMSLAGHVKPR